MQTVLWSSPQFNFRKCLQSSNEINHCFICSPILVHTQPFLSLVLACLKGQEEQREGLLISISRQITQLLSAPSEERCPADVKSKEALQEALHLRISLVGAMFDTIQRSVSLSSDWATLLFQLVSSGTITAESLPSKKYVYQWPLNDNPLEREARWSSSKQSEKRTL